jgi:hypothetical protein
MIPKICFNDKQVLNQLMIISHAKAKYVVTFHYMWSRSDDSRCAIYIASDITPAPQMRLSMPKVPYRQRAFRARSAKEPPNIQVHLHGPKFVVSGCWRDKARIFRPVHPMNNEPCNNSPLFDEASNVHILCALWDARLDCPRHRSTGNQ